MAITQAALQILLAWQKVVLEKELAAVGADYCLISDHVYSDKKNTKFAMMDSKPEVLYLVNLHLPVPQQVENLATLRYFFGKAVS